MCPGKGTVSVPTCKITTCLFQGLWWRGSGCGGMNIQSPSCVPCEGRMCPEGAPFPEFSGLSGPAAEMGAAGLVRRDAVSTPDLQGSPR